MYYMAWAFGSDASPRSNRRRSESPKHRSYSRPCRSRLASLASKYWMKSLIWTKAITESADPKRAKHFLDLLGTTTAGGTLESASAEQARALTALFSGSQALSTLLIAHPDWLISLAPEALRFARQSQGLRAEVGAWLEPLLKARDFGTALARVRLFKQREMLRIGARDLIRPGYPEEITQEISN